MGADVRRLKDDLAKRGSRCCRTRGELPERMVIWNGNRVGIVRDAMEGSGKR